MIFLRSICVSAERGGYPLNIDPILSLSELHLKSPVTLLIGDNGSGKSTLLEALARLMHLPCIGSADAARDATLAHVDPLARAMRLVYTKKPARGFFLRAEDFFGFTKRVSSMQADMRAELMRVDEEYADKSAFTRGQARMAFSASLAALNEDYGTDPDACSHGESFLNLFHRRIQPGGLYLMDEPEAPLSPLRQLSLLSLILSHARDSQFLIATHSPILMACPDAEILSFDDTAMRSVAYDEIEHVRLLKDFLNAPDRYIRHLL